MAGPGDEIRLPLVWRHGRGAFAGYFAALERGEALASRDPHGGRVHFPPRMDADAQPVTLPGTGTVRAITRGPAVLPLHARVVDASFALVAMDGADNLTFGRVLEEGMPVAAGDRVRLARVDGSVPHPAQAACFVPVRDGHGATRTDGERC